MAGCFEGFANEIKSSEDKSKSPFSVGVAVPLDEVGATPTLTKREGGHESRTKSECGLWKSTIP
jgi:hypothetical protein